MVKFIETGSRVVVARDWGEEEMGIYCLMDIELQFHKVKKF